MAEEDAAGVERFDVVEACPGLTGSPFGPVGTAFLPVIDDEGPVGVARDGPVGREEEAASEVEGFAGIEALPTAAGFEAAEVGAGDPAGVGDAETSGWEGAREEAAEGALAQCFLRFAMTA